MTTKANPKSHWQQSFVDRKGASTQEVVNLRQRTKMELGSECWDCISRLKKIEKLEKEDVKTMQISPKNGLAIPLHWNSPLVVGVFFSPVPVSFFHGVF